MRPLVGAFLIATARLGVALSLGVLLALALPVRAEDAAPAIPDTPEAAQALIARLSDEEVRALFLERLVASGTADRPAARAKPLLDTAAGLLTDTGARIWSTVRASPETWRQMRSALSADLGAMGSDRIWRLALALAAGVVAGGLASAAALWAGRRLRAVAPAAALAPPAAPGVLSRYGRNLGGLVLCYLACLAAVSLLADPRDAELGRMLALWGVFVPALVFLTLDALLAPGDSDRRPASVDDAAARILFWNGFGIAVAACAGKIVLGTLALGPATPVPVDAGFWLNIAIFLWSAVTITVGRDGLRQIIRGPTVALTPTDRFIVRTYPPLAAALVAGTWAAGALMVTAGHDDQIRDGRHILTMALLLVAPLFDTAIRTAARRLSPPPSGDGPVALDAHASSIRSLTRIGRAVIISAVLLILARVWEIRLSDVASQNLGEQVAARVISTIYICIVGYFAWEAARLWFNRKLAGEQTAPGLDPHAEDSIAVELSAGSSRLATVLPVVSWTVQAAIVVLTALVALSNVGIDVTALMAGAGIVGLAIGFGSQKLVSDIVSGLFFLFDDAFRIGEYVEVGSVEGTVEKFSLRSLQLRHSRGAVYCIPYSTIPRVTNFGRDWGIMKLRFTVPFGTDVEQVRKIFKRIGQEMMAMPELAPGFIEPFKSQGVREINETGIVIGGKFMFKPGAQFIIRREVYKRVQQEFDKAGIAFARQEVRVAVVGQGAADSAVAGAAASAVVATASPPGALPST